MKTLKYILICSNIFLIFCGIYITVKKIDNDMVKGLLILILLSLESMGLGSFIYFRKRFINFSSEMCRYTDEIMHGNFNNQLHNQETLTSKMVMEMEKVKDIITFHLSESNREKKELQEMISEITHQIKTPVSNITMYCEMFSEPDISYAESKQFIEVIRQQLVKLEFLLDALIKSSRLETDMINLEMENNKIIETLAISVNNVIQKAEHKNIDISVDCRPAIQVYHDMKWTAEAIENILDNAIKYTPPNGKVSISVKTGEMHTEIVVKDNGNGIEATHINDIFKRFYREKSVFKIEGLGLGLYLARHIITLQGGFISVRSTKGKGSCFSIFLPNRVLK